MRHPLILGLILLVAFGLRVYNLDVVPNGLFTDEAARGYDAYSLSLTGADMFGVRWPLFPRSLNDYTPALYTYLTLPFVFLLDLSHFSTRIASVWIGVFTVAVAYQAIRRPFGPVAATAGAALVAISPWYVLLNRIGTEWSLLGLGPMLTIVLAYRGLRRPGWLIGAGAVAGISLYGYAPVKAFLPPADPGVHHLLLARASRSAMGRNSRIDHLLSDGLSGLCFFPYARRVDPAQ